MTLFVGPEASIPELLAEGERIWTRFTDAIPNGPPDAMAVAHEVYAAGGMSATAVTVPGLNEDQRLSDDYWIVLGQRFFASHEDRQILTVLHECIHVRLYAGPLRERTQSGLILRAQTEPTLGPAEWAGWDAASRFRSWCDEILAEQCLKDRWPDWFPDRWAYYLEMRREWFSKRFLDNVEPRFRALAIGYEILRNRLGLELADDPAMRDEFRTMLAELERGFSAAATPDEKECVSALVLASAGLDFRRGAPFELSAFDEAFEWVRTLR